MYAPLHTKSDYSAGYGTAAVERLVERAAHQGYPALALTDIENLYGQVRFHHAARAVGVKAITGVELRAGFTARTSGRKSGRLVLLARDRAGYESLCRIVTQRRDSPETPTIDPARCLDAQPQGLFYLSDDAAALRALLRAGVPASDVRFLLTRPGGQAAPADLRCVADTDMVMTDPADRGLHILRAAIRQHRTVSDVRDAVPAHRSLPAPDRLRRLFHDAPEALAESLRVADQCCLDLTQTARVLPSFDGLASAAAHEHLARNCWDRLDQGRHDGKWPGPVYADRLTRELAMLCQLGLSAYVLVVAEITAGARQKGMAVAARGSAASSLVAHVLGITPVDPIVHGLHFERFLHAGRRDLPDIDLDLPSNRRDELIDWVHHRFGCEQVAMIAAHQTFGWRAAFREGLKALGMSLAAVDQFCARIPDDCAADYAGEPLPLHQLDDRYRQAVPLISALVGKFQHFSVHPGGVVLAQPRVVEHAPLERAPKGVLTTQYDMHSVEKLGLIKIDLLGNRALAAIQETLAWVGVTTEIPDGDPPTLEMLRQGRTIGCFQVETPSLRATLRRMPVRGINDIMAALAIVRPGPASGAAKAAFLRRANGREAARPPHPRLAEALRDTHGMLLYEEDLMSAIAALTGWGLDRADQMRSALISAGENTAELASVQHAFETAAANTGVPARDASAVWEVLTRFAAYSFNKAHAASYSLLAWQSVYLKTHHPEAFACAVLNSYGGLYPLRTLTADFCRHGVRLLAPHVNSSSRACTVEPAGVRVGLSSIKHLTRNARNHILTNRPFRDLADLLKRISFGHRELEALVLSGACDGLHPLHADAYPTAHEEAVARLKADRTDTALEGLTVRPLRGSRQHLYRALVRAHNELRYLGMHLAQHPMRVLRDEAARAGCITLAETVSRIGHPAQLAALVAATRRVATADGQTMQFVTLEDETGLIEAVLSPRTYASLNDPITNPGPFLITGRVRADDGDIHLLVSDVTPFHLRPDPYGTNRLPGL